jgi:hypothetical protein
VPLTGDTLVNKSTAENISDAVKLISKIHWLVTWKDYHQKWAISACSPVP